jgi:hypothetical protein
MPFRKLALSSILTTICVAPCLAQEATSAVGGKPQIVEVTLTGPEDELKGRLLSFDAETLSIEIDRKRVDLPMSRVVLLERRVPDSVWEGAILMSAFVAACSKWWCAQGADHEPSQPAGAIIGALVGGAVGALLDSTIHRHEVLFEAPTSPAEKAVLRRQPRPMIAVGVRF